MFGRRKKEAAAAAAAAAAQPEEKPTPAYLRDDYPYKAVGDPIEDLDTLEDSGVVYEIWCDKCETSIRAQGKKLRETYKMLMAGNGCLNCGSKELVVKRVDMGDLT